MNGIYFANLARPRKKMKTRLPNLRMELVMSKAAFLRFLAPAGLVLAAVAPQSFAASTNGTMNVNLAVAQSCTLAVSRSVDFGNQSPAAQTTLQAGTTASTTSGLLTVNCRKQNSAVTIQLTSASTGTSSGGNMTNPSGTAGQNTVAYSLYLPANTASQSDQCNYTNPSAWPSAGLVLNSWAQTGARQFAVCSTATIDQNTEAGTYSDTVNVVLTY